MPECIENRMVVDSEWNEIEYGVPNRARMRFEKSVYEEMEQDYEREDY